MAKNMGTLDRGLRILAAAIVAVLVATETLTGVWAYILGALALVFLVTSIVSVCPLYSLLGISTCKVKQSQ